MAETGENSIHWRRICPNHRVSLTTEGGLKVAASYFFQRFSGGPKDLTKVREEGPKRDRAMGRLKAHCPMVPPAGQAKCRRGRSRGLSAPAAGSDHPLSGSGRLVGPSD